MKLHEQYEKETGMSWIVGSEVQFEYVEWLEKRDRILLNIIYDMVFAYDNKDDNLSHDFEKTALHSACSVLSGDEKKFSKSVYQKAIGKYGRLDES